MHQFQINVVMTDESKDVLLLFTFKIQSFYVKGYETRPDGFMLYVRSVY